MLYPWVNTALFVLLAVTFVSGFLGLTNGDPGRAWILWLHAGGGYAIACLVGWKAPAAWRSFSRRRLNPFNRTLFLLLAVAGLFVLGSGMLWAWAGRIVIGGYSLLTLHVIVAAGVVVVLLWHVAVMRSVVRVPAARDRRAFMRLGMAASAGAVLWLGGRALMALGELPGASRRFTGSYEVGSYSGRFPTVSWLFDDPDPVDAGGWRLRIDGAVHTPFELSYDGLVHLPATTYDETIDCTGGWYSRQTWTGVPVVVLLDRAGVAEGAGSITISSVTGYERRFSLDEARSALLATRVADQRLSHGHGFPVRLVMPDHRGFDWVKWVDRITVNAHGDIWQSPLPLQ